MENKQAYLSHLVGDYRNHPEHKRKREDTIAKMAKKSFENALERLAHAASDTFTISLFQETWEHAVARQVHSVTDDGIRRHLEAKRKRAEEWKSRMDQPKTTYDFSLKQRTCGLTPEEQEQYDLLLCQEGRDRSRTKSVQAVGGDQNAIHFNVKKTKDTRDHSDLWVVQLTERVEPDEFYEIRCKMASLGGSWSKYTRGFNFRTDPIEILENFNHGGKASTSNENPISKNLRSSAEQLEVKMKDVWDDHWDTVATRIRKIADAWESGQIDWLDGLRMQAHVELFERILLNLEQTLGISVDRSTIHQLHFPAIIVKKDPLQRLTEKVQKRQGAVQAARAILKFISKHSEDENIDVTSVYSDVNKLLAVAILDSSLKQEVKKIQAGLEDVKSLHAMGIKTSPYLRTAMREYLSLVEVSEDDSSDEEEVILLDNVGFEEEEESTSDLLCITFEDEEDEELISLSPEENHLDSVTPFVAEVVELSPVDEMRTVVIASRKNAESIEQFCLF